MEQHETENLELPDEPTEIGIDEDCVEFDPEFLSPLPAAGTPGSFRARLLSATALGWIGSISAHAAMAAGAYVLLVLTATFTPPMVQFGWGDAAAQTGIRDIAGMPDLDPGPAARAATPRQGEPMPEDHPPPAVEKAESTPDLPAEPPPAPVVPLNEPSEPAEPERQIAPSQSALSELPEFAPRKPSIPAPSEATPSGVPGGDPTLASNTQQAGTQTSGDASISSGAGGSASGEGGTADTGRPGIAAGVRNGSRLPRPVYPAESRRRGEQGEVILEIEIRADGTVGQVSIISDAGFPRLGQAAIDSLRGVQFSPALQNGIPIATSLRLPFRFRLK